MKKLWLRVCSLILVAVMMVQSLPVSAFANQTDTIPPASTEDFIELDKMEDLSEIELKDVQVLEENADGRTEFSKEFLLNNGLNLAVIYDSAVHFEKNGQWEEIDNTLQAKANGTYANKAGVWEVEFPQQLTQNNQITITKDGYTLSFGMAGELRQQSNLEVMSTGSEKPQEELDGSQIITDEVNNEESSMDIAVENGSSNLTNLASISQESNLLQSGSGIENIPPEETTPEESTPAETIPEETLPQETIPEETVPVETIPEETVPEETVPEETVPEETVPEETVPEETVPEETVPEETIPETTEPIIIAPEQSELLPTATVMIDGVNETFTVSSVQTAIGQIQTIDRKQALAEADHPETVLEKPFSQLVYGDVYANTDVRYDLIGNQVKESVILDAYSKTLRGYQFTLNVGTLIPVMADNGRIDFYDAEEKNIIMSMPAPYLVDNNNVYCTDVKISLNGNNGIYTLTYVLPQQWLAAADRAWPVILDPIVSADIDVNNIRDKTIGSKYSPGYEYEKNEMGVGTQNGIQRTYIKYDDLPALTSSDVVLKAQISMRKYSSYNGTGTVEVHKVNGTWDSTTITWSNKPSIESKIDDYVRLDSRIWYSWDITDIVRDWYCGENTGMVFKVPDEAEALTSTPSWIQFYSSDNYAENRPVLQIYFRNNNGLEGYWDYTTTSAGRAGTGYVNQYTGNLTWVHSDLGFGGNRMPVSINHVYNANDTTSANFGMGNGWRTNFNQRVYQYTENTLYYVWEDADGTAHYFYYDSANTYKDEDGLELTLKTNGSGEQKYSITDKYGNISYFDTTGRLRKQKNNQKAPSYISVFYTSDSSNLIDYITDGAGRKYDFTYSSNRLSKIAYFGTKTTEITNISYTYTSGNLTSITYKDGEKANFTYGTNNLMTSAADIDGYKLKYEYNTTTAGQPSRVSKISEYDGSIAGGVLNIEYAHNQTTLTDHNGNVQILQFNDMGNTVCIQDGEGHAQYAQFAKNNAEESTKGNQLKASSKLQNTVNNLLSDSSFDGSLSWTVASGTATITTGGYSGNKSLLVTGGRVNSSTFSVASGESCTFSAYVKTTGSGASLALYAGSTALATQVFPSCSSWTRVEVSYTNTSSSSKTVNAALLCASGQKVYMDCVQVEKMPTASRYNLVQNSDFTNTTGWTSSGFDSGDGSATATTAAAPQLNTKAIKIVGSPTAAKKISQTINVSGSKNDAYIIAGWAKADSVPLDTTGEAREFGIRLLFNNTDNTTTEFVARFNPDTNSTENWQYSATAAVAKKAYNSITIEAVYAYNANTAYFDGIQLFKEQFSTSYTYDENGNVVSVVDLQKKTTQYEYTNNDLTKEILPSGSELTYVYDDYHNVISATTTEGLVYTFVYDDYGNNITVSTTHNNKTISTSATYSNSGNTLSKVTDAAGKVTVYDYDKDTNVLNSLKLPKQETTQRTNYTYDEMYRMASAAATTDTGLSLSANYTYTDDLLTKIQTGSTVYNFNYGNFGLRSNVKVGSNTLASYTYTTQNNYLDTLAYGNGDSVKYTYDNQGRVTKQTFEDGDTVTYLYDNDGALATVTDSDSGISTTYYYDFIDRMMKYVESGTNYSHSVGYTYDAKNNLSGITENINGTDYTTSYAYDDDNRVTQMSSGSTYLNYTYNGHGLLGSSTLQHQSTDVISTEYSYRDIDTTAGTITSQVKTQTMTIGSNETVLEYSYDSHGNFSAVKKNGVRTGYVYDTADQLVRENNVAAGKAWLYTYDNAGNILTKAEYDYTNGTLGDLENTITYTYGNSNWGDLLTQYNGRNIIYDNIGNPVRGYGQNYTWEHGRELAKLGIDSSFAITKQPEYSEGLLGDWLYFSIEAVGENLTYQWQASTNNGRTWSNSSVGGYNTPTMNMELRDYNNGYLYRCKVTDGNGNILVSEPVALVCVPIHITQQPTDFYGTTGDTVQFSVVAEGTGLTYQWQSSTNSGRTWNSSSATGNKTATMSVSLTANNPGYQYRCKITDSSGNIVYSQPGTIRTDSVAIIKQPEDYVGTVGSTAHYSIEAYGTGLTYQWQVSTTNGQKWNTSSATGSKTASITLAVTENNPGYLYRCKVTDSSGNVVYSEPGEVKVPQIAWSNTYNADGLRTQRTNGYTTYKYIYNGDKLSQMTVGDDVLRFGYSPSGVPLYVQWNDARYFYVTNLQGDVLAIVSKNGNAVVEYTYDAWGNILTTTGSRADNLGKLNPLRYRGYVYDEEYGLYYLQSRYYNPEVGRFLNADEATNLGAEENFAGFNLFAYCVNNPVNRTDESGNASLPNWAKVAIGIGIIAGAAALTVATGGAAVGTVLAAVNCMAQGAMVGAITQGAIGAASGAASGAIIHRMTTGSWSGAANAAIDGAATGFMTGTITGAVSGALSSPYCFVAGTTVLVASGLAAIETIREGDYVWAWDEEAGTVGLKKVVETYVNETDELVHVHVNGEEIITTPSHPFYSPVKGWTHAIHLRAGDILVLVNGEYVVVEKVQHEILEAPIEVYNFQVEDYHTYYVTNAGVLVHNSCKHQSSEWKTTRSDYWKDQAAKGGNDTWYNPDAKNLDLMRQGKAPIGYDGERVVLHHVKGIANDMKNFVEIGAKAHRAFHKAFGYKNFIDIFLV